MKCSLSHNQLLYIQLTSLTLKFNLKKKGYEVNYYVRIYGKKELNFNFRRIYHSDCSYWLGHTDLCHNPLYLTLRLRFLYTDSTYPCLHVARFGRFHLRRQLA